MLSQMMRMMGADQGCNESEEKKAVSDDSDEAAPPNWGDGDSISQHRNTVARPNICY